MNTSLVTRIIGTLILGASVLCAQPVPAAPSPQTPSPSTPAFKTFTVYSSQPGKKPHYVPSGYMGDNDILLSATTRNTGERESLSLRINYKGSGPKGWAGIYWQDPANNWGERAGQAGYDLRGATKLTFRARGEIGGERIREFRVGGIVGRYPDSDVATLTNVKLTQEWQRYEINLKNKDLRHIIGGFGIFLNKSENRGGAVLYVDDVIFEGPLSSTAASQEPSQILGRPPEPPQATPPAPPAPAPAEVKDLQIKEEEGGLKVSFSSSLMFSTGKSVLEAQSNKVLNQVITLLAAYPDNKVLVEGHTDSTGDKALNLKLSELRAQAVKDYLVKSGGYDTARFSVVGYGDSKPVASNATRSGRSLNRRVEVTILKSATEKK